MIKIELTKENTPEDVISEAGKFGRSFELSKLPRDTYVIAKAGGYYICEGVRISEELCKVRIIPVVGDFLTHPRSGKLKLQPYFDNQMNQYVLSGIDAGGWDEKKVELFNRTTYPLQDNDNGTWLVSADDTTIDWVNEENYGNCWWTGVDGTILSWKGPPNGFSISGIWSIPGLSRVETTDSNGSNSLYTVFDVYIYQDGSILCHGPQWFVNDEIKSLVAGAMYIGGVLYSLVVTNKVEPPGFYLQLWSTVDTGKTWKFINEVKVNTRLRLPAQIAPDGLSFVYDDVLYKLNPSTFIFSKISEVPTVSRGNRTVTGRGGYKSNYTYSGLSSNLFSGMTELGDLVYSKVSIPSAEFKYEYGNDPTTKTKTVPVYKGNPATSVSVSQVGSVTAEWITFVADVGGGSYCSVEWSGVDRSDGVYGYVKSNLCNTTFSVTATVQPQGLSDTYNRTYEPAELAVTGDQGIAGTSGPVDTQYTATGAIGEITWSTTQGTISPTGLADFSGGCGTAVVTATDQCGRSASISVALENGGWVVDAGFVFQGEAGVCPGGFVTEIVGTSAYGGCYAEYYPNNCGLTPESCANADGISAPVSAAICVVNEGNPALSTCFKWKNIQGKSDWGCPTP